MPPINPAKAILLVSQRRAPRVSRVGLLFASALGALVLATACGGRGTGSASGAPGETSCYVHASDYDQSCTADADCTYVPFGGNVCDTCSNSYGCLFCSFAPINIDAAQGYLTALRGRISADSIGCTYGTCLLFPAADGGGLATPTCQAGRCTSNALDHCE